MKRAHTYRILSLIILLLGIIFTISGVLLQTLPLSSKSAVLIFSISFILTGTVSFAVHHKKYLAVKNLCAHHVPVIAHWTYAPNSSNTLKTFINEQKSNTFATATLVLILSLIFSIIFAYSGGSYILYLGYTLAILCLLVFIITLRFISAYYQDLAESESEVIFGEDSIYFLDELYTIKKSLYFLQKVSLYAGDEHLLVLDYGLYDIDEPASYSITIPVPRGKVLAATYLRDYYSQLIETI